MTTVFLDSASAALAKGDLFCLVADANGLSVVTKATSGALSASGGVHGIATAAIIPGQSGPSLSKGLIPRDVTGLAAGNAGPVRVSSSGRCERVGAYANGDYPVGHVNANGVLNFLPPFALSNVPSGITSVSGTSPVQSTGGANPTISVLAATTSNAGSISSTQLIRALKLDAWTDIVPTAQYTTIAIGDGRRRRLVANYGVPVMSNPNVGDVRRALWIDIMSTGAVDGDSIEILKTGTDRNEVRFRDGTSSVVLAVCPQSRRGLYVFRFRGSAWTLESASADSLPTAPDVRDFGADPLFFNDSSAAFQAAFDTGYQNILYNLVRYDVEIYIPAGHYKINETIVLPRLPQSAKLKVRGDGRGLTYIEYMGASALASGISVTFASSTAYVGTITRSSGSWITDGFVDHMALEISGSVSNNFDDANYKHPRIVSVTATVLTVATFDALTAEGPVAVTIRGRGSCFVTDPDPANHFIGNYDLSDLTISCPANQRCFDYSQPAETYVFDDGRLNLSAHNLQLYSGGGNTRGIFKARLINRSLFVDCSAFFISSSPSTPNNAYAFWLDGNYHWLKVRTEVNGCGLIYTGQGGEITLQSCRAEGHWGAPAYDFKNCIYLTLNRTAVECKGEDPALYRFTSCSSAVLSGVGVGTPVVSGVYKPGIKLLDCQHFIVEPTYSLDFNIPIGVYLVDSDADCRNIVVRNHYTYSVSTPPQCNFLGRDCREEFWHSGSTFDAGLGGPIGAMRSVGITPAQEISGNQGWYDAGERSGSDLILGGGHGYQPGTNAAGGIVCDLREKVSGVSAAIKIKIDGGVVEETHESSSTLTTTTTGKNRAFTTDGSLSLFGDDSISVSSTSGASISGSSVTVVASGAEQFGADSAGFSFRGYDKSAPLVFAMPANHTESTSLDESNASSVANVLGTVVRELLRKGLFKYDGLALQYGVSAWYRADFSANVVSGGKIATLTNRTRATAYDLTQGTAGNRFDYTADFGDGAPCIESNGTGWLTGTAAWNPNDDHTIIILERNTADSYLFNLYNAANANTKNDEGVRILPGTAAAVVANDVPDASPSLVLTHTVNAWRIFTLRRTGNNWNARVYSSGPTLVQQTNATYSGTILNDTFVFGAFNVAGSNAWRGQFRDVQIYNYALSDSRIDALLAQMSSDWPSI